MASIHTDEGIMHEITGREITITRRVFTYPNNQGSVYCGVYSGITVGIKVKLHDGYNPTAIEEFRAWRLLQHTNVIRLYDCFFANARSESYLVFVMEWCQSDAFREIEERKRTSRYYEEMELWRIAGGLIDGLAAMQRSGLAHRNIKLQNVYPFPDAPKIGDFSCAKAIDPAKFRTIHASTPVFLSPELRIAQAYGLAFNDSDSFKADAYSLGVVLLSLAKLEVPQCFQPALIQANEVETLVQELPFFEPFKQLLRAMLADRAAQRLDFLQLDEMHKKLTASLA